MPIGFKVTAACALICEEVLQLTFHRKNVKGKFKAIGMIELFLLASNYVYIAVITHLRKQTMIGVCLSHWLFQYI